MKKILSLMDSIMVVGNFTSEHEPVDHFKRKPQFELKASLTKQFILVQRPGGATRCRPKVISPFIGVLNLHQ